MFQKAIKGDRVWSMENGWGTVVSVTPDIKYPIHVDFDCGESVIFTVDGKTFEHDRLPSVFWGKIELPEAPKVKKSIAVSSYVVFDTANGQPERVASFEVEKDAIDFISNVGSYDYCKISGEFNFYGQR